MKLQIEYPASISVTLKPSEVDVLIKILDNAPKLTKKERGVLNPVILARSLASFNKVFK